MNANEEKNPIQVAGKIFLVLEFLAEHGPFGLSELSRSLELNKATAHRILTSLCYMGYVNQNERTSKYDLTFKLLELGSQRLKRVDILESIHPILCDLAADVGETVHLVQRDGTQAIYIDKVETSQSSLRLVSHIGKRIPLYCSGVGKAILASLSDTDIQNIWEHSRIQKLTKHTIVEWAPFMQDIAAIRDRGYSLDNEENEVGVRCVAITLDGRGAPTSYAISVSAPVSRMTEERIPQVVTKLFAAKKELEHSWHLL